MPCLSGLDNNITYRPKHLVLPCGLAVLCFLLMGCSGDDGKRIAIAGTVLKDGEPIPGNAWIDFEPLEPKTSIGSFSALTDGAFNISKQSGPTPGRKYKVIVTTKPGFPKEGVPASEQKFPEKFSGTVEIGDKNVNKLEIDVEAIKPLELPAGFGPNQGLMKLK